jgi:hypothetical protein
MFVTQENIVGPPSLGTAVIIQDDCRGKTYRPCQQHESESMHVVDFFPRL